MPGQSIQPGDAFVQVRPAPGFKADVAVVTEPAERDGWWWVHWCLRPSDSRVPEHALLNQRVYRHLKRPGDDR